MKIKRIKRSLKQQIKIYKLFIKTKKRMGKKNQVKPVEFTSNLIDRSFRFECPLCHSKWQSQVNNNNSCPSCGTRDIKPINNPYGTKSMS